jgi:hypothetical protein
MSNQAKNQAAFVKAELDEREKNRIRSMQSAFVAPTAAAVISMSYVDKNTGEIEEFAFVMSGEDPELRQLLNDYGARKSLAFIQPHIH